MRQRREAMSLRSISPDALLLDAFAGHYVMGRWRDSVLFRCSLALHELGDGQHCDCCRLFELSVA